MKTPYTEAGLRQYDHLNPLVAVIMAWTNPGPRPDWHNQTRGVVRDAMPLLARALDRLVAEGSHGQLVVEGSEQHDRLSAGEDTPSHKL